jgi:hypothetical protein
MAVMIFFEKPFFSVCLEATGGPQDHDVCLESG